MFTRTWFLFMQLLFARLGGINQITTEDLAQSPPEVDWTVVVLTQIDALRLQTEISELRSLVNEQAKAIFDLQQVTK